MVECLFVKYYLQLINCLGFAQNLLKKSYVHHFSFRKNRFEFAPELQAMCQCKC